MHPARIDAVLSVLKPEELRDAYGFIDVFERFGTMSRADADEWRRRIQAQREFLGLKADPGTVS